MKWKKIHRTIFYKLLWLYILMQLNTTGQTTIMKCALTWICGCRVCLFDPISSIAYVNITKWANKIKRVLKDSWLMKVRKLILKRMKEGNLILLIKIKIKRRRRNQKIKTRKILKNMLLLRERNVIRINRRQIHQAEAVEREDRV